MELVTGFHNKKHITSAKDGSRNASICGSGSYVMATGEQFAISATSNNIFKILDGDAMHQGRHALIEKGSYEEVEIANGLAGLNRNDLIVIRYSKDASTGIEQASLEVIQGTSTDASASDPEYNQGSILDGDILVDMPLYRVRLEGIAVAGIDCLFEVVEPLNEIYRPTYEETSGVSLLKSGETLKTAFSKIASAIKNLASHLLDNVKHITATERATWNAKQNAITGGATTITGSNLTASRALISNSSGKVAVSAVTSTELGYLDGVTGNIQTQLDSKATYNHSHTAYMPKTGGNFTGAVTGPTDSKNIFKWGLVQIVQNMLKCQRSQDNLYLSTLSDSTYVYTNGGGICSQNVAGSAYVPVWASAFTVTSSKKVKENINAITDEEAQKILDVNVVSFDYKESFGGQKNNYGVLAEEVINIMPSVVVVPDEYDEELFDEEKGVNQPILSVDYSKFVPYLIKMVQMQQKEIEALKDKIS